MKCICSNGLELEVREIGEVIFKMTLRGEVALPIMNHEIHSDEHAKGLLNNLKETGYYNSIIPEKRVF